MAVGEAHVFPGFLTPVLIQLFFPRPPDYFSHMPLQRGEAKITGKKVRLDRGSNSQLQGHESDTLTTEPPRRGPVSKRERGGEREREREREREQTDSQSVRQIENPCFRVHKLSIFIKSD